MCFCGVDMSPPWPWGGVSGSPGSGWRVPGVPGPLVGGPPPGGRSACYFRYPRAGVRKPAAALTAVLGRRAPCAPQSACHRIDLWRCGHGPGRMAGAVTEPAGSRLIPMSLSVVTGLLTAHRESP